MLYTCTGVTHVFCHAASRNVQRDVMMVLLVSYKYLNLSTNVQGILHQ